jgi:hypothetical protein
MRTDLSNTAAAASRGLRLSALLLPVVVLSLALVPALKSQAFPANAAFFNELRWRSIGPPRSGYISAPAGVPGDPTTYYVGMPEGGVWKTTNAGTTWKPIFDSVRVPSIGAVAVAPSEPNTVYVGTGNQSGWSFTPGDGINKSTDAGRTWSNIGLRESQYIGAIVVDPHDANRVLVAAQGGRGAGRGGRGGAPDNSGERGVYRTTDGGRTWTRVLPADGSAGASDLYYDFSDPQSVYASLSAGAAASGAGVFKSMDGGATWQAKGGRGLPDGTRIAALAVSSGTHGKRLYALAGGGRGGVSGGSGGVRGLFAPTTAARPGRSAPSNSRAPAAKSTPTPRTPTSCTSWARRCTARLMAAATSRRIGARRVARIRDFCGSIPRTRSA